jgi:hypothetical protein
MIGSSERWPTWVTEYPIKWWETFCAATALPPHRNEVKPLVEELYRI